MTDSEIYPNRQARSSHSAVSGESGGVLLVDDSHKNRRMARDVLGRAGFNVMTAADGFDALAKVVAHRPSIIFADTVLPRLDGYQTCALIRNNIDYQDVCVVMLCGGPLPFDKARAKMFGIDSSLAKPLTEEALLAAIDRHQQKGTPGDDSLSPGP